MYVIWDSTFVKFDYGIYEFSKGNLKNELLSSKFKFRDSWMDTTIKFNKNTCCPKSYIYGM